MGETIHNARLHKILIISTISIGLFLAYSNRFVQDDAFISFRYAYNLATGDGLTVSINSPTLGMELLLSETFSIDPTIAASTSVPPNI